jgi:hypothetical protein
VVAGHNTSMGIVVLVVVLMIVAAMAVAAGALDGPRRARRRVIVREPDVVVERPTRSVVTERRVVTDNDPLI